MSFSIKTLNEKKVTFQSIKSPGVKYFDRTIIDLDEIYVPDNNKVRKYSKNIPHIQKLTKSFMNGINYSKMPPVVRKKTQLVNGRRYEYELICGNHRMEALVACGYDKWIFDIYDICLDGYNYDDSVCTLQLQENDHEPTLASTADDITNTICRLIEKGSKLVDNTEASIDNYVEQYCPNTHWNTKGKIVRQVVAAKGAYQDIITYTPHDINNWMRENSSYKNEGQFDKKRNMCGWTCKTRYEPDTIFSILKKLNDTGKESYIIAHTSAPTGNVTLDDKRHAILDNFERWEEIFVTMIEFYNENGRFPWKIEGFLPQDNMANEDKTSLVTIGALKKTMAPLLKILQAAKKKSA